MKQRDASDQFMSSVVEIVTRKAEIRSEISVLVQRWSALSGVGKRFSAEVMERGPETDTG